MQRFFMLLLFTGISSGILAQKLGYFQNDSAYIGGYVYMQSEIHSAKTCMFSQGLNKKIVTYTADQISAWGYGKFDYYSFKIKSGNDSVKMFLQAIVPGDNPVYYLNKTTGKQFYILGDKKELVELVKKNREYKLQLATYFNAPSGIVPGIHTRFNRRGIIKTVRIVKDAALANFSGISDLNDPAQKVLTIKQKKWLRMEKPLAIVTIQSGLTFLRLPIDLKVGLPSDWDKLKATSISYSMAIDIPIIKYWPVTYHQEICFNKFVTDYKQGAKPPDYQLIQNSSVISLPAMLRYTFGRKEFTWFINAGIQLDIVLNKNNVGWLILGTGDEVSVTVPVTTNYLDYNTFQPGITGGFGLNYKLNRKLAINSEFRYSSVFNVLPGKAGAESQSVIKIGISYNIFKEGK